MPFPEDDAPTPERVDPELRQVAGLFDLPAFARRGQELEHALRRLHERCRQERELRLDMVRLRLRQWAAAVEGPEAWREVFASPIDHLWRQAAAPPPAPEHWGQALLPSRRRVRVARDLEASVIRFNRRWSQYLESLDLSSLNVLVDHYNRFYLLEKECVFRSARLAARHFQPRPPVSPASLLHEHPLLSVPPLVRRR